MPLVFAAGRDRVVEGERPVDDAAGDLPAVGHLAQRRGIERRRHAGLTVSTAARIATFGLAMPMACARGRSRSARCRALASQRRRDIDGGVGDQQRLRVGRHVQHEDVADAPRGAQAVLAADHLGHQFVGVQAALHQGFALAGPAQRHRDLGRGVAVRGIDDPAVADVHAELFGNPADLRLGADQRRHDQAFGRGRAGRRAATPRRRGGPPPSRWPSGRG
jgi:hypothetical protein